MSPDQIALFILLLAVGATWYTLLRNLWTYPCSGFRYKLWALRDRAVDDIRDGRLPNSPAPWQLVRTLEALIRNAPTITLVRWLSTPPAPKEVVQRYRQLRNAAKESMDPGAHVVYARLERDLSVVVTQHLLFGCMSGWIFVPLLLPIVLSMLTVTVLGRIREGVSVLACAVRPAVALLLMAYTIESPRLISIGHRTPSDRAALALCAS